MKHIFHPKKLPLLVLAAGALGLLLRLWLQLTGVDAKGFLVENHPARILLWILSIATLAGLFYLTRNLREANKYRFNFPASPIGGIGIALGALGVGLTCIIELTAGVRGIDLVCCLLGILSGLMLGFSAYCRWKGLHPSPLTHTVISLFFMLRLICYYRHWSADPMVLDYCFQLLATVCVMLSAYYRAMFDANYGSRRPYAFFTLAAVYCCCLSFVSWQDILFFLSIGCWMITDLCSLQPLAAPKDEPQEAA